MAKSVLVTGGAGYIGSHACVELLNHGYDVTVVDNLSNSSQESLRRVGEITGKKLQFGKVDLLDAAALDAVFKAKRFDAVLHFAGLKAVGESGEIPLRYYTNNVTGTLVLLETMKRHGVKDLVFSSSATVYGEPARLPLTEGSALGPTNPYGRTKLMIEDICRDLARAERDWRIILLRYFNPVGAHASGKIGEDPRGIPNNLVPYILQVAVGRLPKLRVFGADWPTPDGTGVRDYIHVVDLVLGHLAALDALAKTKGCVAYNLGTGRGSSVLEMVRAVEEASGKRIAYEVVARRPGDIASCWADPGLAAEALSWRATRGIAAMCADSWRWQSGNPNGYSA
ncbi:MAG: UDP-glucose 4-epimerase GalE [Planctomycetes bacterium]|nr:UDP-glucose 4-epimerase GalE [Planctomycetota bacterium]